MFHFLLCLPFNPLLYLEVGHELVSTRPENGFPNGGLEAAMIVINDGGGKERRQHCVSPNFLGEKFGGGQPSGVGLAGFIERLCSGPVHAHTHAHAHTRMHAHAHTDAHMDTCAYAHTLMTTHTCAHMTCAHAGPHSKFTRAQPLDFMLCFPVCLDPLPDRSWLWSSP